MQSTLQQGNANGHVPAEVLDALLKRSYANSFICSRFFDCTG